MVCYVKDITEQKKLETKIQHTEKIASIGQLAAGIAHEINNPLGVILCHIDLIKGEADLSPEVRSDLETIEKHAGNCRTIIADLLKFAHQQASVKEPMPSTPLSRVHHGRSQFRKQQIEIDTFISTRNIPMVDRRPDKIKQVLVNILLNSAQAIGEDGTITLYCAIMRQPHGNRLSRTRPGIPAEMLDKIFDPFFTSKPPGKGTGLVSRSVTASSVIITEISPRSTSGKTHPLHHFPACQGE